MISIKAVSLAMLMGSSAMAVPAKRQVVYATDVEVDTVVVATATQWVAPGYQAPTPTPSPASYDVVTVTEGASSPASPTPVASSPSASAPAPAGGLPSLGGLMPKLGGGSGSGSSDCPLGDYLSTINKYRLAQGKSPLQTSQELEQGIKQTVENTTPEAMEHHFYDSMATGQVLAPGSPSDFAHTYVMGWLCEIPTLPGLNGICDSSKNNFEYDGTGHADILTRDDITKCGCWNAGGLTGCEVA